MRINPDGSIPGDNPFVTTTTGQNKAIWALGFRNPFTFAVQPGTGWMYINDVGQQTWEEVNHAVAGSNYGWADVEGPTNDPRFRSPIFYYGHGGNSSTGCAITGGTFYNPTTAQFPATYVGDYFFADYCSGWIRKLDPANGNTVVDFASGATSPVDLAVANDGSLYYLSRGQSGSVYRIAYTASQAPTITTHPASQTVSVGRPVTFDVTASGSAPHSYQWQRNGGNISGATSSSYTSASAKLSDNGARFRVRVTNSAGSALSNEAVLTVTSNQPPTATINTPAAGTLYSAGQTIGYSGTASDPEDGNPPASRFTWRVDFHHADHIHPFSPTSGGTKTGSFTVPTTGHTETNVWYRINLTVTDSGGLYSSTYRDVNPRLVQLQLATNPTGLQLLLDDQPVTAPLSFTAVVGVERLFEAVSPQTASGATWTFQSWSNGGARAHTVSTPGANTTYTAAYTSSSPPPPPPPPSPPPPPPPPSGFSVNVDFQPESSTPYLGYLVDGGRLYGPRGNGYTYGWNRDNTHAMRDRDDVNSPDQRYDTIAYTMKRPNRDGYWEIEVPNGQYTVRLVVGDSFETDSDYRFTLEGVLALTGVPSESQRFFETTTSVNVSDGRLTIANGDDADNNRICFVEITGA
jgi:hypothetical protein